MQIHVAPAKPDDAPVIAEMVGELLGEIIAAIGTQAFGFHQGDTAARAHSWLTRQCYTVLLARAADGGAVLGFLALYESYALYAEGAFGTIPELFVRPAYRSRGIGRTLLAEAKRIGQSRGWTRLEVTTPPLPQFDRTLAFYRQHGFSVSGGRKLKADL